ncbi:MAG: cellulase family glycosylhydrolase [Zoogloeaceae bacterium]|nr:cellulase family glycosylhydrolase [Rhodocyclaceae bacterium]MCP5237325.1 cellulase family glycosylhydrolase [Zoogloeaceae bacterium]
MSSYCRPSTTARRAVSAIHARWVALLPALLLAILVNIPVAQAASLIVDSFDDRSDPSPWHAWVADSTGASLALSLTQGHQSSGALRLDYTFDCRVANSNCGQYALAIRGYAEPIPANKVMALAARMPLVATLYLRIVDGSGQTLQYAVKRPDEAYDAAAWFAGVVDLTKPREYWGGTRSGRIDGGIRSVRFLVTTRTGKAESGAVDIDAIRLLDETPVAQPSGFSGGQILIDDFEDRSVVLPWRPWHSAGSGTAASLNSIAGHGSTRALRLDYQFACLVAGSNCGEYALAIYNFSTALPVAAALRFATRSPAAALVMVRIVDASGQTLQYAVDRPPEGFDPNVWYAAVVDLAEPETHWGGADSGRIEQGVKSVRLLVSTRTGRAEAGGVDIDDVVLLDAVPAAQPPAVVDGTQVIDDFEDRPVVQPWSAWSTDGSGTRASVASQAGFESARGMRLDYAFDCRIAGSTCGQYAMVSLGLQTPVQPLAALAFATRSPLAANLSVRVIDAGGQTLQYRLVRPPSGYEPGAWYQAVVDLSAPQAFWGGAASGRVEQHIVSVRILVETRSGMAEAGAVEIDRVAQLAELPAPDTPVLVNGEVLIDDFEDRSVVQPWALWHSAGAGTSASLATGPGFESTRGMHLDYAFGCLTAGQTCGEYAAAALSFEQPIEARAALALMTRSPSYLQLHARIVDASGQTLQYRLIRPLSGYDPQSWYRAVADLVRPDQFWGGAASGRIEGGIRRIQLLASSAAGAVVAGVLEVDRVSLLTAVPDPVRTLGETALTIDDFDQRSVLGPWRFDSGDALSTGSVERVTAAGGGALALNYELTCSGTACGSHVVAQLGLPEPVEAGRAIAFRALSPGNVDLALRVIDATGETFQYMVPRTVEGASEALWYPAHVLLDAPDNWWGGDADGVVDGPIQGIAVVARNALSRAASGRVLIDALAMEPDVDTVYALDHGAPRIVPAAIDRSVGARFGAAFHPGGSEAQIGAAAAIDLSMLRLDLFWVRVERDGTFDFSYYDAVVDAIRARGLRVLLILDYGHPDHDFRTAEGIAAYARFAAAAAQRYAGDDVAFEIWNEPDHASYWAGAPNARQYAALASAAMSAMRSVAPDAVISTGGLSYFDLPYLTEMLAAGAADLADAVAIHAYGRPEALPANWVTADRLIRDQLGAQLPIWLTEWGFSLGMAGLGEDGSDPEFLDRQAKLTARSLLVHWALGAEVSIAYKLTGLSDDPLSVQENFALHDWSLTAKPAALAIRAFLDIAAGRSNRGLLADVPAGLHVMVLEDVDEIVYVAWQSEDDRRTILDVPLAGLLGMADHLGNGWMPPTSAVNPGSATLVLDEADGPVFIRYAR